VPPGSTARSISRSGECRVLSGSRSLLQRKCLRFGGCALVGSRTRCCKWNLAPAPLLACPTWIEPVAEEKI